MSTLLHRPWRANGHTAEPRSVTLSIDAELLATATAMNIDLAAALDAALRSIVAARADQTLSEAANCNIAVTEAPSPW